MSKEIRQLTKDGEVFYPLTHIDALVGNNGSGVDDEPVAGSENLVKSGGVWDSIQPLSQEFYQKNLKFLKTEKGYYYKTSVGEGNIVGDKIKATSGTTSCIMEQCEPYDTFIITGRGAGEARLYAFLDSEKRIIKATGIFAETSNKVLIAPPNSAYIVVNFTRNSDALFKGYNEFDYLNIRIEGTLITAQYSQGGTVPYKFVAGRKYLLQRIDGNVSLSLREEGESSSVQSIGNLNSANTSILFTADVNCGGLRYGPPSISPCSFILSEEGSVPYQLYEESIRIKESTFEIIEGLGFDTVDNFTFTTVAYANNHLCPFRIIKGETYIIEIIDGAGKVQLSTYDTLSKKIVQGSFVLLDTQYPQQRYTFIPTADADAIRHGAGWSKDITIRFSRLNNQRFINEELKRLDHYPPMVSFELKQDVIDVSKYMEGIDFNSFINNEYLKFPLDLLEAFNDLVSSHPDDIEKIDAAEMLDLQYPIYTSLEGNESGEYLPTPSYREWLFKISSPLNYEGGNQNEKKVLLLISGTHGNERGAQFNSYILARRLCEDYLEDLNLFKLRMAFDIYILPILDVYGSYHSTRVNANGVNINRNLYRGDSNTSLLPFDRDYPGITGCSEFESEIVVALTQKLKPFVAIDHHSNIDVPFYSTIRIPHYIKTAFNALADISFAAKKKYPNIFGNDCSLLKSINAPSSLGGAANTIERWWTLNAEKSEDIVHFAATIEIDQGLNYNEGSYTPNASGIFSIEAMSIAEYTLRSQLLLYCEEALKREKRNITSKYTNNEYF